MEQYPTMSLLVQLLQIYSMVVVVVVVVVVSVSV